MAVNDHWIYQGRQSHGWFGNGTAPEEDGDDATDEIFRPANAGQRVDHVADGIAARVPRSERGDWTEASSNTVREHLKTAIAAWFGASALSRDAFRTHFLDPDVSDETVDDLRGAAWNVVKAKTYDDLARAGAYLAAAARKVGARQWPRFVDEAEHRAVEAASRGDIPGVVKASAADTLVGVMLLGGALIIVPELYPDVFGPTGKVPAAPLPSSPTILHHDGPDDADPAGGQAAPADGSKQPQAPAAAPVGTKNGRFDLPANPDDLLKEGWVETSHPKAAEKGRRTFENPRTGEKIEFDKGRPGESGFKDKDHYHYVNPDKTGKRDEYLDGNGNPVPDGHRRSHIMPGRK